MLQRAFGGLWGNLCHVCRCSYSGHATVHTHFDNQPYEEEPEAGRTTEGQSSIPGADVELWGTHDHLFNTGGPYHGVKVAGL